MFTLPGGSSPLVFQSALSSSSAPKTPAAFMARTPTMAGGASAFIPAFVSGVGRASRQTVLGGVDSLRRVPNRPEGVRPRILCNVRPNQGIYAKSSDAPEDEQGISKGTQDAFQPEKGSLTTADGEKPDPVLRAFNDLSLLFAKVSQMMRWEVNKAEAQSQVKAEESAKANASENEVLSCDGSATDPSMSDPALDPALTEWLDEFPSSEVFAHDTKNTTSTQDDNGLAVEKAHERLEKVLAEIYSLTFNAALAAAFLSVKAYLTHAPLNPDLVKMTRWLMDRLNALAFDAPEGVEFKAADIPGTEAEWVLNENNKDAENLVIFVPGGCYLFETPHKQVLGMLVQAADTRALKVSIPTVLEACYPAQMNVLAKTLDHLLDTKQAKMENLYLMGDSAGGHAIMSYLADRMLAGKPVPKVILISPWADFTLSGESLESNRARDHFIPPERIPEIVDLMKGDTPVDDPRLSPAVSLTQVHPDHEPQSAFLVCSDTEVLRDDAVRLAQRLQDLGWAVDLNVYVPDREHEILPHAFAAVPGLVPQGRDALDKMAEFVSKLQK